MWPAAEWEPAASRCDRLGDLVDEVFADPATFGDTYAVVVIEQGRLTHERYGGTLPSFTGPGSPVTVATPLLSWSMAKSMTHAAVGLLVGDGRLDPSQPAPVAAWSSDDRATITLDQLLEMRDGLDFVEDYVDDRVSDVIEMLFGAGSDDVAGYATGRPLLHPPGAVFNYSSGTSNIVARIAGDVVGGGEDGMRSFLHERLFAPIGMTTADPRFDAVGTFIGSSYVYATARDFARFGLLYLRDGMWSGQRILPEGWVDHGRRLRSIDPDNGRGYGAHWWVVVDDEYGTFWASGYHGQMIVCVPALDVVLVRCGRTDASLGPNLYDWRARVTAALAE